MYLGKHWHELLDHICAKILMLLVLPFPGNKNLIMKNNQRHTIFFSNFIFSSKFIRKEEIKNNGKVVKSS